MIKLIYSKDCPACVQTKPIFESMISTSPVPMVMEEINNDHLALFQTYGEKKVKKQDNMLVRDETGRVVKEALVSVPAIFFFDKEKNYLGHVIGINKDQIEFLVRELYV